MRIAHPFRGGTRKQEYQVPKGRLNQCHKNGKWNRHLAFADFNRPFGTWVTANLNPAVNCRAILNAPSGRKVAAHFAPPPFWLNAAFVSAWSSSSAGLSACLSFKAIRSMNRIPFR